MFEILRPLLFYLWCYFCVFCCWFCGWFRCWSVGFVLVLILVVAVVVFWQAVDTAPCEGVLNFDIPIFFECAMF